MLAYLARLIIFAIVTLTTIPASADALCDFFNNVVRDTKRRNCWPAPFECPDRQTVRTPFATMVHNGWRKQNTLSDFHFETTTGQLNEAGKLKIRWIILEAPLQHREIYVHIGQTPEETQTRLASVNDQAATLVPQNEIPPIMQTTISDSGSPADRVDLIERKYQSSMPAPRLPSASGQSGSPGSGGSQ
jgi:hypothetical protein